jgi:hypothetical protein
VHDAGLGVRAAEKVTKDQVGHVLGGEPAVAVIVVELVTMGAIITSLS